MSQTFDLLFGSTNFGFVKRRRYGPLHLSEDLLRRRVQPPVNESPQLEHGAVLGGRRRWEATPERNQIKKRKMMIIIIIIIKRTTTTILLDVAVKTKASIRHVTAAGPIIKDEEYSTGFFLMAFLYLSGYEYKHYEKYTLCSLVGKMSTYLQTYLRQIKLLLVLELNNNISHESPPKISNGRASWEL